MRRFELFVAGIAVLWAVSPLAVVADVSAAELFPLTDVRLLDGPLEHAMQLNRDHLMQYDPDRLLAPFRQEAGLSAKAQRYGSWESGGLDGHTAGHYLSALAYTYAATGDQKCFRRLSYMIDELADGQAANANGYVGGIPNSRQLWDEIAAGTIRANGFGLNGRWVPLYNLHKTFAGIRDAWTVAHIDKAKDVLIRLADWCDRLVANLSDEQLQDMLRSEHGGMNEVLADVAVVAGQEKYLQLAKRFSHRTLLEPLAHGEDRLNGLHANTQVPKVIGFERIAGLAHDDRYHRAAVTFWDVVTEARTIAFGGNSIAEHFPSPQQSMEWIEKREGPETCNTYNMLRLTEQLFMSEPQVRYADFYERAVFNHILSSQHPQHGGYVYFTSARPQHYRTYSQPEQSFWCCVGSGMENHGKYGQFIYAHDNDTIFVNLFVASELDWKPKGIKIRQETTFPHDFSSRLIVSVERPKTLALKIRYPAWVADGNMQCKINQETVDVTTKPGSYFSLERLWNDGDVVELLFPATLRTESLPYLEDYVAFLYGPIVLAAKTDSNDMPDLLAGDGRWDHVANGPLRPLDQAPTLVSADPAQIADSVEPIAGKTLTFRFADVVRPVEFRDLELVPFFTVHDSRYVLYWRNVTAQRYDKILSDLKQQERQRLALDTQTIDRVAPGQQQPEADHGFQGERTSTGMWQDRSFRHADGWFSYQLQTKKRRDIQLMVTYFGSDRRKFDILLNDRLLKSVELDAPLPGKFIDVRYDIPDEALGELTNGILTVKFAAHEGSMAGGIFDVRLLAR